MTQQGEPKTVKANSEARTAEERANIARTGILCAVTEFLGHYFNLLEAHGEAQWSKPELVKGLLIELPSEELAEVLRRKTLGEPETVTAYRNFVADHLVKGAVYRLHGYDLHPFRADRGDVASRYAAASQASSSGA